MTVYKLWKLLIFIVAMCFCPHSQPSKTIILLCIYRPPVSPRNKLTVKDFRLEFQDLLDTYATKKPVILGDFNFHFDNKQDINVKKLDQILSTYGLIQHVSTPTQIRGHILDWVIADQATPIGNLSVLDKAISDHSVITFNLKMQKPEPVKRTITCRNLKAIDEGSLAHDIEGEALIVKQMDTGLMLGALNTNLRAILDKHAPLRTRTVTDRPSAPWMNEKVKEAKKERRRAERAWRKSGFTVHRDIFKTCTNKLKEIIDREKSAYYRNKIENSTSTRTLFTISNFLCGKSNEKVLPQNILCKDLLEKFGNFFSDKIALIRQDLDAYAFDTVCHDSFVGNTWSDFDLVSCEIVKETIMSSPKKSCILDPIPTDLFIKNINCLLPIVTDIINDSLLSGTVPLSFKHAIITPLLKKANLSCEDFKNYRPVSNLPFLSKILEKIVLKQLKAHLSKFNLMDPFQSA